MRIVFMGTPEFAVPSLETLVEHGYPPVAVVTGPDRPRGRGQTMSPTPVKRVAQAHDLPVLTPESVRSESFAREIAELEPDCIVVVAFKILPPEIFTQARRGAFNLHASLLPRYRGAAPINRAIMDGAERTGVTTFFLEEDVDTGPIILQREVKVGPNETAGELHDRLKEIGAEAVLETVRRIESGNVETRSQDDELASPAPKLDSEEGRIDWTRPAAELHDHVRGLSPYPGAWTMDGESRLKIYRSRPVSGDASKADSGAANPSDDDASSETEGTTDAAAIGRTGNAAPGTVLRADRRLVVACGEGALELLDIQQPGRSVLDAEDFLNGYDLSEGTVLGT